MSLLLASPGPPTALYSPTPPAPPPQRKKGTAPCATLETASIKIFSSKHLLFFVCGLLRKQQLQYPKSV